MVLNKAGREIPQEYADQYGVYEGELARIKPYEAASRKIKPVEPRQEKLLGSIREAIEKTGLKDGMTISFHHHFREGDYVINMVMDEIAKMGIKKPINRSIFNRERTRTINRTHQKWCHYKHHFIWFT